MVRALVLIVIVVIFFLWAMYQLGKGVHTRYIYSHAKWQPRWEMHGTEEIMYLTRTGKGSTRLGSVEVTDPEYDYKKSELESEAIQICTSRNSSDKSLKRWGG